MSTLEQKQTIEVDMIPVGNNGISPIVETEEIEGGHRVTFKDIRGETSFDVANGKDGKDGEPGKDGKDAQDVLTVNLTMPDPSGYVADKTFEEVEEAYNAEKLVIMRYNKVVYALYRRGSGVGGSYHYDFRQIVEGYVTDPPAAYEIQMSYSGITVNKADIPYATDTVTKSNNYLPTAKAVYDFVTTQLEAIPNAAEVGY